MSGEGSQTASDRFFGSVTYLLPMVDVYFFGLFVFQQFPILQQLFEPLAPLMAINNNQIGGLLLFLGLYLGVVINRNISRFIRFNVLQSILISILISLCGLILQYVILPLFSTSVITQVIMNIIFFGTIAISIYGIVMSALGKYTEIGKLSEAAHVQIDRS